MIDIRDLDFQYSGRDAFQMRVEEWHVAPGEHVAVIGPSGCGKTTLLHLIAGILEPAHGTLHVDDRDLTSLSDAARRQFRCTRIGLVFQEFELIEYLSVLDNILLAYRLNPVLRLTAEVRQRACGLAARMQLGGKLARRVNQLSQGERQRVAICRALLVEPALVLADEPTGNLDPGNKQRALEMLLEFAREHHAALVTVTHDHGLLGYFQRVVDLTSLVEMDRLADEGR